jgi:predicted lipid-binding transport protein (Tim44 family)
VVADHSQKLKSGFAGILKGTTPRLPNIYFSTLSDCDTFPRMPGPTFSSNAPQFGTAQYANEGGPETCKSCNQPIGAEYYRVSGALACPTCAQLAATKMPNDNHAAFVRGITYGVGGAILGLILYAAVGILTGLVIGYVALAVGYVVAKGIKMGSRGIGGQRYQIAAALLTYAAVSMASIPMGIAQYVKAKEARAASANSQAARDAYATAAPSDDASGVEAPPVRPAQTPPASPRRPVNFGSLLGSLMLAGLASPFSDFWKNGPSIGVEIRLFILFIAIRIAWKMTEDSGAAHVLGPFKS